ncbi:MAG: hypothetical protein A2017_20140 [Lentisphaerae bacterium GWF2_44_16]|nr:MAG: hypothetical protein A2017_20140 [Lentisphaerae bacterium GWF2_44_16]
MDRKNILLVEDERRIRTGLAFILTEAGYRVNAAEDGKEALCMALAISGNGEHIHILMTDIQMPNMSGFDLINELREKKIQPDLIMAISGYGDKKTVDELKNNGCDEFVQKPFKPEELLKKLQDALIKKTNHCEKTK